MSVTEAIQNAIDELRHTFPETTVTYVPDGQGGAWVTIDEVPLGPAFTPSSSWMSFQITYPYPEADVYPHFVRPDMVRSDGAGHGEGFALTSFGPRNEPAMQLSRRSNRLNPAVDTAATKAIKVLRWLEQR